MPQECIRLSVFLTASGLSTRSPVIGQKPPLARVAAMTLALSHVTSMEHSWRSTQNKKQLQFGVGKVGTDEREGGGRAGRGNKAHHQPELPEAAFPRNPS